VSSSAQPAHPIALEVESGVHQFEIHKVDPDSVSVKLGASFKFTFTRNEVRSATSAVAGAAGANAKVLLNRFRNLDPSKLTRMEEDLGQSAKELAALHAVYQWLIPETTATWTRVEAARKSVEGTRQALRAADSLKRTLNQYLIQGYPFPEDWKQVFEKAHDALAGIPIEDLRESEIDRLSYQYERFENLTHRQSDRSYTHIEDLTKEIEDLLATENLTNGQWGQLRVRIDRALARVPEEESRNTIAESLAPLRAEVEAFLDRNRERLAIQEIEERLAQLEGLSEIPAASAETFSFEVNLVSTLLSGIGQAEMKKSFEARLASIKEKIQNAASMTMEESPTKPAQPSPPPPFTDAQEQIPEVPAPIQPPSPLDASATSPPPPPPPASTPLFRNRNVLIAGGAGFCVLLLLVLARLLRKNRKGSTPPSAPRVVFKEPPPAAALPPVREDEYLREFSKPAPPLGQKQAADTQPIAEPPSSPFPDLPAIVEPAPTPRLHSGKPEDISLEEAPTSPPDPAPTAPTHEMDLDDFFTESAAGEESPSLEPSKDPLESETPTPFPTLEDEITPSLESVFGGSPEYRPAPEPAPETAPEDRDTEPPVEMAPTPDREEEAPQEFGLPTESEWETAAPEKDPQFAEDGPRSEEEQPVEVNEEEPVSAETATEAPDLSQPPQESGRSISLVFEDMAAPAEKPSSAPPKETDFSETEASFAPEEPTPSLPPAPIELEPLVLEGQLVELDGSESILFSGVSYRLDQGIPFAGLRPVQLFPLGQAIGLVGEMNGHLELSLLDRRVDGTLASSTVLLDSPNIYSISRRLGVYWVQDSVGTAAYEAVEGKVNRIESKNSVKGAGRKPPEPPRGLKQVHRPVCSLEDHLYFVLPEGRLDCFRLDEEAEPRGVDRLWSFSSGEDSRNLVSNAVPLGDRIAVLDAERNLILVEPSNGAVYWEGPLEDAYIPPSGPVVLTSTGNRLVYIAKAGEKGMRIADFTGPGVPTNSHSILKCKTPALFGMEDGILLVSDTEIAFFEERELALSWSLPLDGVAPVDLSVDRSQIAILVREPEGYTRVIVLGKNSGSVLWETEADEADMTRIAGVVVQDGNLLIWGESEKGEGVLRLVE
jgi:hypothetical protein